MKSIEKSIEDLFLITVKEQLAECSRPARVVCALSGGADSTALLMLLADYASVLNIVPVAAYMNHGIRDADILADEDRRVESLCSHLNIPLFTKHLSPGFLEWYAARKRIGTEAAARTFRYHFLDRVLDRDEMKGRLALGHNRNDQEETVMMRLFTGAGLQGLRGIPEYSGRVIRPLINIDRSRIEAYLQKHRIDAVEDESNRGNDYLRNRVRNQVLPQVREIFPKAGEALSGLGKSMNEVLDHYESLLEESCSWSFKNGRFSCSEEDFLALPPVTRRMVLLGRRNVLLQGQERSERIPGAFLNALDNLKGEKILKGYGILFYRKKGRLVLEADQTGKNREQRFFLLSAEHPYIGESCILRFQKSFDPDSGGAEDLVWPVGEDSPLSVRKAEGADKKAVLFNGRKAILCLADDVPEPFKGIKIKKRIDSDGFSGLPCVIIELRG